MWKELQCIMGKGWNIRFTDVTLACGDDQQEQDEQTLNGTQDLQM
jgi:hypothetical protein